jgi:glycosyl transferase family 25
MLSQIKSFVINLDRRPERWKKLLSEPDSNKIPNLQRFSAIDGSKIDIDNDSRISTYARYNIKNHTRRSHDLLDSVGGVGCALSHITLWQQLVNSKDEVYLILEDDIQLPYGTWQRIEELYVANPELADLTKWDIWSVGNLRCEIRPTENNISKTGARSGKPEWILCREFIGLQAYFITRNGAQKLLKEAFPVQQHIDWFITYFAATSNIPFRIIHNRYINIQQQPVGSDIATKSVCAICDVPTNVESTHWLFPKAEGNLLLLTIISASLLSYLVFGSRLRLLS